MRRVPFSPVVVLAILAFTVGPTAQSVRPGDASAAGSLQASAVQAARGPQPTPPCGQNLPAAIKNIDKQSRCFELRTYTVREGSSIDLLHSRFRDNTTALFQKHGMNVIGYWQPVGKPDTLVYLLAYKDSAARDASWAAFGVDPAWVKARTEMVVNLQIETTFMNATDYSPMK